MTEQPLSPRRALTRDRLMDAALDAFAEKGVLASSVEEICERAGFTRGAFYSNFESKEDLCVAVTARATDEIMVAIRAAVDSLPTEFTQTTDITDVIDAAVGVFLDKTVTSPTRVAAFMELRLFIRRQPGLLPLVGVMNAKDAVFTEMLAAALNRVSYTLRIPADLAIKVLNAVAEQDMLESADPATIHQHLTAILTALVLPPEP